mgnify:CR=1 FL=1|jgi:hypothetical protein
MEMCYNEALVMPSNYVVMDNDEMTYVDGGVYISNTQIRDVVTAFRLTNCANPGMLSAALIPILPLATSWINALPVGGQIIFAFICASTAYVAGQFAIAYFSGKGVDISLKYGVVPNFTVK